MGRELPLADFMARHAGIRSLRRRLRLFSRSGPANQLWHLVSANAVVDRLCLSLLSVCPWTSKSVACVEMVTLMLGCGGDRRSTQVPSLESQVWWGSESSCMVEGFLYGALLLSTLPTVLGVIVRPAA